MLNASELKYPTRKYFGLDIYVISPEEKYEVLKAAYLCEPVPGPNAVLEDIHTEREFLFKDLLVVKNGDLVELETPFFMDGGGSVIDWVPALSPRHSSPTMCSRLTRSRSGPSGAATQESNGNFCKRRGN